MSRNPHDQFAKQFLEELLAPFGQVELSREILGESRWVDLWFQPVTQEFQPAAIDLGLLGRMTETPCLLGPYRNAPDFDDIRSCLSKLYAVIADQKRRDSSIQETDLPYLWILVPTVSEASWEYCGAVLEPTFPSGCYTLPRLFRTYIIAIHQLPKTSTTLWLRLLGKGRCQSEAIREVIALPNPAPRRDLALELLVNWKIALEILPQPPEDEDTVMALSQAYREWELKTIQIGEQRGIQIGEQRGLEQQRGMLLDLLRMELEIKFGEQGLALIPFLGEVEGLTDLYELLKAIKPMTTWEQMQDWWFDRLATMMAEGDRLDPWLGVALKLQFPEQDGAAIEALRQELSLLEWQDARRRLRTGN
ncbi:MAG: flagellar assembly protein H [Prochlorotrichaceae cyanobacterium]|jgi:hypothetical protein